MEDAAERILLTGDLPSPAEPAVRLPVPHPVPVPAADPLRRRTCPRCGRCGPSTRRVPLRRADRVRGHRPGTDRRRPRGRRAGSARAHGPERVDQYLIDGRARDSIASSGDIHRGPHERVRRRELRAAGRGAAHPVRSHPRRRAGAARQANDNLFRPRERATRPGLDVAASTGCSTVDAGARTADVQGMTTYEHLVDATLPHGLMPLVVPQLKTITLGGAVTGLGIESRRSATGCRTSRCVEMDVLTGDGRGRHRHAPTASTPTCSPASPTPTARSATRCG